LLRRQTLFLVAIGVITVACAAAARRTPAGGPLIRSDRAEYVAVADAEGIGLDVIVTMTNVTVDTLWLHPCVQQPPFPPVVVLDRLEAAAWRPAWGPFCTRALMNPPPRLLPGASRIDTVRVRWSRRERTSPGLPPWPVEGTFRLRYSDVYRRWRGGFDTTLECEPVHDSLLASNVFRISR
jgi:hypothetical protein